VELGGDAGEGFGWWSEAVAGARGCGFELGGGENAESAGVAGGEMLLDSLVLGVGKFAVDEGVEFAGIEMIGAEMFG
jgi:hypothetical protein